jgi:hypothetical protein
MTDTFTIPDTAPAPEPVTIADAEPGTDPEAPYGRFANGKPRKAPAPKRAARQAPAPKPSAGPRPPKAKGAPDFRPMVEQTMGMISMGLVAMSGGGRNRAFLADAAAVQMAAPEGARVVNDLAKLNPGLARALEQTAPAVPYMQLGTFLFGLGAQLAANHGVRLPIPGAQVQDPEHLAMGMEQQLRGMAEQQQAEAEAAQREAQWLREVREKTEGRDDANAPADHGFAAA